jgi:hypothetical protein
MCNFLSITLAVVPGKEIIQYWKLNWVIQLPNPFIGRASILSRNIADKRTLQATD